MGYGGLGCAKILFLDLGEAPRTVLTLYGHQAAVYL